MKPIFLTLLAMTALLSPFIQATSYSELRKDFKIGLYSRQQGLMEFNQYDSFIEPYIAQAEQILDIPHYLQNNACCYTQDYFYYLLNYNVACFHYFIKNNAMTRTKFEQHGNILLKVINNIKQKYQLTFDPETEFNKTTQLLMKANKAYYKKLKYAHQLMLSLM